VRCVLWPREDELTAASLQLLGAATWTVRPDSNRIRLRLQGPAPEPDLWSCAQAGAAMTIHLRLEAGRGQSSRP
jgi:allophanate hydrolase subunit 2